MQRGARRRHRRCSASASATRSSAGRSGFGTYKLRYGHRGINQPVHGPRHRQGRDHRAEPRVRRRRAAATAPFDTPFGRARGQPRLPQRRRRRGPALPRRARPSRVQYHPEAAAGPHDAAYLFDRFADLMATARGRALMPTPRRHQQRPGDRLRPDRHRPGLRVRLLRHPGLPGAARRGPAGHPGQLQPGDDHDRPGVRRRHLRRADHPGGRREDHRQGAPRRPAADPRRPDRAERRDGAARARASSRSTASS